MALGALVDAGCELSQIESHLRQLPLDEWKISAAKVRRKGLTATQVTVEFHESRHHRSLSHILELLSQGALPARVQKRASAIFERLGEAEARVHGIPVEEVHFHEVGAVDAIVDIAGVSAGLELLGVDAMVCSALNVGGGRVQTEHGILPVPAPATADLLRGAPTYSTGIDRELVTPTGAAIVATLASRFGAQPAITVEAVGCGAGAADLAEQPNVLRLFVGEAAEERAGESGVGSVVVLETNVDDMNPQIYGYFVDRALAAGALEVFSTPALMKKNRPGQLLTVLCEPAAEEALTKLIFQETTTLGVRRFVAERRILGRELVTVETAFGPIRMKVARQNDRMLNAAPEYEDCRRIAAERNVPLKRVLEEAAFEFRKQYGGSN